MIKLFGFSILRNGVKYDYSFKESLLSISPITKQIYLALDEGEDSTSKELASINSLKIIPTIWDMSLKKGLVLSVETNKAIAALRADHGEDEQAWGIYLQADEVLHEDDYELLKNDLEKAQAEGCDAISFRYLHFWQTHHHLVISKKWYPQEIRAIKLKTNIESWGDAQGFKNFTKVYNSEVRIFHYGHVREHDSYQKKILDFHKFYHPVDAVEKVFSEGLKKDKKNKCILYFGTHPRVMKERILSMKDIWQLEEKDVVYIVGNSQSFSSTLVKSIAARKIIWSEKISEIPKIHRAAAVITKPNFLDYFCKRTTVPKKMKSSYARDWSSDFRFILQVSERHIGFKSL